MKNVQKSKRGKAYKKKESKREQEQEEKKKKYKEKIFQTAKKLNESLSNNIPSLILTVMCQAY